MIDTGMNALAGFDYVMYNPEDGYNITWANDVSSISSAWTSWRMGPDADAPHKVFWPQGSEETSRDALWVYFIRNNSWDPVVYIMPPDAIWQSHERGDHDMVVIAQKYAKHLPGTGIKWGLAWRYFVIPYQAFAYKASGNMSQFSFQVGGDNLTAFIVIPGAGNFTRSVYMNNTFAFGIGQMWGSETVGKQSMWKMVGQLLTCTLPDTNEYAGAIMAICLWSVITFVAVGMISRFIPTIPGL